MYNFKDIAPSSQDSVFLPSEAMKFNGIFLEEAIADYRTLTVTGRDSLKSNIISESVDGMDGSIYFDSNYSSRDITVRFLISAKTASELNRKMDAIKYYTCRKQAEISFNDDLNYSYIGTVSEITDPPPGYLNAVGEIRIFCHDPYKRRTASLISGVGSVTVSGLDKYSALPEYIKVTPAAKVGAINIQSGNKTIELMGTFNANEPIFLYPSEQSVKRGGVERTDFLVWDTDFENFYLKSGDTVSVTPDTCNIELQLRERLP